MVIRELEVKKADGLQRVDAQAIVQRAMRFSSSIIFEWKTCKVNAKSFMGVVSMGLKRGDKVMAIINGEDQDDALTEMQSLFANNFKIS